MKLVSFEAVGLVFGLLVAATDLGAQTTCSALDPLPESEWSWEKAAHLVRRAGFASPPEQVQKVYELGLFGAVESLLSGPELSDDLAFEPWVEGRTTRKQLADMTPEERQKAIRSQRRDDRRQIEAFRSWWVQRMIQTPDPLLEKMTLFWHGHFTSEYRDVKNSYHLILQNETQRQHAFGNFRDLTLAMSRDLAMLEYLDNRQNRRQHPNENYARELLELFTLGIGNYTEADIQEAARALTGWTFRGNTFVEARRQHDPDEKTFLGRTGRLDGEDVIDIIFEQPAASTYLPRQLFEFFAYESPSSEIVAELGRVFQEAGFEMKPLLRTLFVSREFYSDRAIGTQIKSPVELIVGLARTLKLDVRRADRLARGMGSLGQMLFEPPNVKGWDGGRSWVTTSALLDRYNLCSALVGQVEDRRRLASARPRAGAGKTRAPAPKARDEAGREAAAPPGRAEGTDAPERARQEALGRQGARRRTSQGNVSIFNPIAEVRRLPRKDARAIASHFARLLLSQPPGESMQASLVEYLETGPEGERRPFHPALEDARERIHGLLKLIVNTPEFQLQ